MSAGSKGLHVQANKTLAPNDHHPERSPLDRQRTAPTTARHTGTAWNEDELISTVTMFSTPLLWVRSHWIAPQAIRAEVWALGSRHRGQVLDGARREARTPGLSTYRAILLQAVIRTQSGRAANCDVDGL